MADFQLQNDLVYTFTIHVEDANGDIVPAPAGDTFSVASSSADLGVATGTDANGNPAVVCTPLVVSGTGYTVTTSDSAGLKVATNVFDIVPDTAPTQLVLDTTNPSTTSQAAPTAPGTSGGTTTPPAGP